MSQVTVIESSDFENVVLKSSEPVLVDFYADWCGPCRALAPKLEELSESFSGKAKIVKVNVDNSQDIAGQYGVRGIPAMFFFKDGELQGQLVGNQPKESIEEALNELT